MKTINPFATATLAITTLPLYARCKYATVVQECEFVHYV